MSAASSAVRRLELVGLGFLAPVLRLAIGEDPRAQLRELWRAAGVPAVAIVGFDDFDWAISLNPPLTTIAQSSYDIGVNAATLLLARIGDPDLPKRTVVLNTELKVRASCGAANKNKAFRGFSFEQST